MGRVKKVKPLTREQYLKRFSRAVRWRLPPQEAEEAIADYRELIFQPERDEKMLVEELGEPIHAANLLTNEKAYHRWLRVFVVLSFGLLLLAKWAWTAHSPFNIMGLGACWYPVWVMAVSLPLSLYWFRRHGQKNGPLSGRLVPALAVVLAYGVGTLAWTWYVMEPEVLRNFVEAHPGAIPWQVILLRELLINGGVALAVIALAALLLSKCCDRRWLALYLLCLTLAAMFGFVELNLVRMDFSVPGPEVMQSYLFSRILPLGIVGLIGTGGALC